MRTLHSVVSSLRHTGSSKISYLVWNSTSNRESQQKRNMTVVNNRPDTKLAPTRGIIKFHRSHVRLRSSSNNFSYGSLNVVSCSCSGKVRYREEYECFTSLMSLPTYEMIKPVSKHHSVESGYKNFFVFTKLLSTTNALVPTST